MATKTISIELDVYERLRRLKSVPGESFSQVLRRSLPGPSYWTGADMLKAIESGTWKGLGISDEGLRIVEEVTNTDSPPSDPWERNKRMEKP